MKTIIIAEIGENHYGQWDMCRGLTAEAARCGATIAKYQTYKAEQFPFDHPERKWFNRVAMPEKVHFEMHELCRNLGIRFMSSPVSVGAARFLINEMKCDEIKLASRVLTHFLLLDFINSQSNIVKTVYLSTGMATVSEIREALRHLARIETTYILHCVTQYPTEDEDVNLRCILTLQREFPGIPIGYSDHSRGIDACIAAVSMGAQVLEKHITYNTRMPGTDHAGGMTPGNLADMVGRIERLEKMLGSGEKKLTSGEKEIVRLARMPLPEVEFHLG